MEVVERRRQAGVGEEVGECVWQDEARVSALY
jgi:hypothetical protein